MDSLRLLLSTNQSNRLKKEKEALDRIDDPKLPRHTVYQGDRKIQQLGQDAIENGVIINNQSVAIGEVMLPLAKGNVLRRVDKTNGGALLGTAYRGAVENDFDANGNRNSTALSRNGGNEPSDPISPNGGGGGGSSGRVPPPFGCVPPPPQCFWSTSPTAPQGFQGYGDAVVNENAVPLYLYCVAGSSVPANLGCSFLDEPPAPPVTTYSCSGGVCSPDPSGIYSSLEACLSALVPPSFSGGQCDTTYTVQGYLRRNSSAFGDQTLGFFANPADSPVPLSANFGALSISPGFGGTAFIPNGTGGGRVAFYDKNGVERFSHGDISSSLIEDMSFTLVTLGRQDSLPDSCGDPPSTCPI